MRLLTWLHGIPTRHLVGFSLLGMLLAAAALLPSHDGYSRAESQRIGWQPAAEFDDLARDVYERVNDERAERGLPALAWDGDLAELARGWSERMIETGAYEHSTPAYRAHPRFSGGSAENIAKGQRTASELHVGWMRSDGHRSNILSADLDAIGIGIVCRNDGTMWATQIFGRHEPGPPQPAADSAREPIVRQDRGPRCR